MIPEIKTAIKHYLGNPRLKRDGVNIPMTEDQVLEYARCSQDPHYFIEKYVKMITLDRGYVNIELYPFQKDAIDTIEKERRIIIKAGRQVGKCFFINTKVKVKNNITNKIYEITIGDFYEHLSRMSDVRKEDETIEFPFKEYTQDNNRRIQNTTSKQPTSVRIFDEPIFGKIQGRKESSISTWREVFTILQKICGYNRYGNTQKSSKYQKEKRKLTTEEQSAFDKRLSDISSLENGILIEEEKRKFDPSGIPVRMEVKTEKRSPNF